MGRGPRINIKGAVYYVTSRGDHEQDIFNSDADYNTYLELLKKYKGQFAFKLFAFILLPNHIHLLIELTGDSTISQIMHALNSNYTKYFNSRYDRKGHLFQERYKMVIAEKAPYLPSITAYIHQHPVRLGLAKDPGEYRYSSYLNYQGKDNVHIRVDREESIRAISEEQYGVLSKELSKGGIIGSQGFVETAKAKLEIEKAKLEPFAQMIIRDSRNRKIMIMGGSILLAAGIISSYLYIKTAVAKQRLNQEIKNMDERYRADKVSYEAMTRRLELEKKRVGELEKM